MDDNNANMQNNSSSSPDSLPKGGSFFQKGKNSFRKVGNGIKEGIGRGVQAIWNRLPPKAKLIIIAVVIVIAILILISTLLIGMISETTNVANENVENFFSNAENLDKDAKELFEDKSSLISLKISDVNDIFDKFVIDNKGGSETQVLMRYEIGDNEVKDSEKNKRIVDISDKLPLYKHILMTEKYNFNSIKWIKYTHSKTSGVKVKDFKEDKDKGLKYPDDSKFENGNENTTPMKLEKFIDLTLPYLQTWYIPLAMSNASVISGTEEDSNRTPQFSYNIIKEAYSNIVVNWYELRTHTLVTKYQTYDEVKYHDVIDGIQVIESVYENGGRSYSFRSYGNAQKKEDSRVAKNTATDNGLASGTRDPMKEDYNSEKDEYNTNFYLKEARVFDAKIINSFNHQVYLDSDVNNRRNPKSKSETSATYARAADNVQNRYSAGSISINESGIPYIGGVSANVSLTSAPYEISTDDPSNSVKERRVYTYIMTLPQYTDYENGLEYTVTRVWRDTLEQTGSETSDYTTDDLVAYNESDDRNEKVSGSELCGEGYASTSSYSGSFSEGTSAPATEIKIGNYTYPVFAQGNYGQTRHGGQTIAVAGCGLCSLTTVVGGITGRKVDPVSCGNDTGWTGPKTLEGIASDLKNVYNINAKAIWWANNSSGGSISEKERITKQTIIEAMRNNNPVIALIKPGGNFYLGTYQAHYVTIVGMEGDTLIIANSAGGLENRENIDTVIHNIYVGATSFECGIVVADRGNSSGSSGVISGNSSTASSRGNGQAKEKDSDLASTGYTSIFTSGTTGRQFKNYKQNNNSSFLSKWPVENYANSGGWSSECGSVSCMILGSGYSKNATFADMYQKLAPSGDTKISAFISDYTGQNPNLSIPSLSALKNELASGSVCVFHDSGYSLSGSGHYMTILDISADKSKVYVSNPDYYEGSIHSIPTGWNDISRIYNYIDQIYIVKDVGDKVKYTSGSGITSLDGFLFIGDSRTVLMKNELTSLGRNIEVRAASSSKPSDWTSTCRTGDATVILGTPIAAFPSTVKGISIALGVNEAKSGVNSMKTVLNNLSEKYPNTPIFVNNVLYVGKNYSLGSYKATEFNQDIDRFNEQIKTFCESKSNMTYIDVSDGLYENGALKSSCSVDEVHFTSAANKTLAQNIKNAILSSESDGENSSSGENSCTGTASGKYYTQLKKTDGLNRIDFMNSNPDIFHRYIRDGGEYLEYVGYARSKLNLSYWNLKNVFQKVYEKHDGSLPWAYGKTLGFENIYSSQNNSKNLSSGGRFIWPVPEYVEAGLSMWEQITSTFGNRVHPISHQPGNMHNGIDISSHSVNANAKIVAAASGEVILVVDNIPGTTEYNSYGNHVIIKHSDGYYTLYGHMAYGSLKVKVGDKVNSGQEIGTMGTTGSSTGNHLHFEIAKIDGEISPSEYYSSTRLDPCDFFNEDCSPIGGVGDQLADYIWGFEGGSREYLEALGYLTDNGQNLVIFIDPISGTRAIGIGLDLDAGGFAPIFEKLGYSTAVGAKIPLEVAEKVYYDFVSKRCEKIITETSGLNLKQCQIDALISRSYQLGFQGAYYYNGMTFNEAYQRWWKDSDFGPTVNYNHPLYTNFMFQLAGQYSNGRWVSYEDRRKSEFRLFQTGVYDRSFSNP